MIAGDICQRVTAGNSASCHCSLLQITNDSGSEAKRWLGQDKSDRVMRTAVGESSRSDTRALQLLL